MYIAGVCAVIGAVQLFVPALGHSAPPDPMDEDDAAPPWRSPQA